MAKIGLSKPYMAVYSESSGTVTYSSGGTIGKYTEMNINLDTADDNVLYADNAPAETETTFSGGTFDMTTDDLSAENMKKILGLEEETISTSGITTTSPKWMLFNDNQATPYLGVGGIIKKKIGGATKWVAFVLNKVKFTNPSISAITQGATTEWGTQQITANIMRNDEDEHEWFRISTALDTEADAEAVIKDYLDIT